MQLIHVSIIESKNQVLDRSQVPEGNTTVLLVNSVVKSLRMTYCYTYESVHHAALTRKASSFSGGLLTQRKLTLENEQTGRDLEEHSTITGQFLSHPSFPGSIICVIIEAGRC